MATPSLLYPLARTDTLPLYTPRSQPTPNIETASIRSGAPSYTSDVPSYHTSPSRRTSVHLDSQSLNVVPHGLSTTASPMASTPPTGLPRMEYAPGFRVWRSSMFHSEDTSGPLNKRPSSLGDSERDLPGTSTIKNRSQRPTNSTRKGRTVISIALEPLGSQHPPRIPRECPSSSSQSRGTRRRSSMESDLLGTPLALPADASKQQQQPCQSCMGTVMELESPASPLEDPELVGTAAAAMARCQRLYLADLRNGNRDLDDDDVVAMRTQEAKTWDFMIAQMTDWEERERNWQRYSNDIGNSRPRFLGTRSTTFRWASRT